MVFVNPIRLKEKYVPRVGQKYPVSRTILAVLREEEVARRNPEVILASAGLIGKPGRNASYLEDHAHLTITATLILEGIGKPNQRWEFVNQGRRTLKENPA